MLFLGTVIFSSTAFAQKYIVNTTLYSTKDGLSDNLVHRFLEDSRGLVWIATRRGINRFDGQNFKIFYQNGNPENSQVGKLMEDIQGNIWVAFYKNRQQPEQGLLYYIIDSQFKIHDIRDYFSDALPFTNEQIFWVQQTNENLLFFTLTDGSIYSFGGKFNFLAQDDAYQSAFVSQRTEENGDMHILTDEAIVTLNKKGEIVRTFDIPEENYRTSYWTGSKSFFWSKPFFEKGIFEAFAITEFDEALLKGNSTEKAIMTDEYRIFHYPQNESAAYCRTKGNQIALLSENYEVIYDFSEDLKQSIQKFYVDVGLLLRPNQIWFSNHDGFGVVDFKPNPFDQYLNEGSSFSTRGITKLANDELLVVAYRQTSLIDEQNQTVEAIKLDKRITKQVVIELNNQEILFGISGTEIQRYNRKTGNATLIGIAEKDKENYQGIPFFVVYQDKQKKIWVGSTKGILRYDSKRNEVVADIDYNQFLDLKEANINDFKEYEEGIWVATSKGLGLMNQQGKIVAHHPILSNLDVKHFHREEDVFWLASMSHGLVRWNKKTGETTVFDKTHGILNNQLMAVYPDTLGNLWLSSEKGLIRFEKESETAQVFLESDGITNNEFNISSHYQAEDGKIYLGGLNGVTAFYPEKVEFKEEKESPFILTNYTQSDGDTTINKMADFIENPIIQLTPKITSTTLHFSYLNYKNVENTRFAFKIEGLDKDWIYQSENFIRLNRLPYGNYQLKVKAQDYSSRWVEEELSIPLEVIAPFYQQIWWQLLALGFAFLLTFLGFKWTLRSNELEQKKLELLVQNRTATIELQKTELSKLNTSLQISNDTKDRLFAILGHDLRNPVLSFQSLSKSLNYLLNSKQYDRIIDVGTFLEKQAQELYHLLDNLLHWALSQRNDLPLAMTNVKLSTIVNTVFKNNEYLSEIANVSLQSEVSEDIFVESDARILETVFRNLVSNAFRFTKPGGQVKFAAKKIQQQIEIKVSDDGIGMSSEKLASLFNINSLQTNQQQDGRLSLGLHLCRELIELVGGQITVESEEGRGTLFTIVLPATKTSIC